MVNKKHPDFPEYKRKFDRLWEALERKLNEADRAVRPGLDDAATAKIMKEHSAKVSALQKEYKHLFQ